MTYPRWQDGKLVKGRGIMQNLMEVDSALGVYSTGKNMAEARKNFVKALELHLSVLGEKATEIAV